jgi:hypothetical protein
LVPTPNGSDDFIRISRPGERLGTRIGFSDVPVDGLLKIDHRMEDAALEPLAGQLGEEAFSGCLDRWVRKRQVDYPLGHIRAKRLDPGGASLARAAGR